MSKAKRNWRDVRMMVYGAAGAYNACGLYLAHVLGSYQSPHLRVGLALFLLSFVLYGLETNAHD